MNKFWRTAIRLGKYASSSLIGTAVDMLVLWLCSDDLYGQWGLNAPAYFAYDDVAVRFSKDDTALPHLSTLQGGSRRGAQ